MAKSVAYSFDWMLEDKKCSTVTVYTDKTIEVIDYTDIPVERVFGLHSDTATYKDLLEFYKTRCLPETRYNLKQVLESGGLSFYNPFTIIQKTKGRMTDDLFWIELHYGM